MIKQFLQKIFKIISYGIFFKIYGRIEQSKDCNDDNRIKVEAVSIEKHPEYKYKVYKIKNGRLYTDRIHDTAVILDGKIIEGPSFQQRRHQNLHIYNSKISDNVVFKKGTPRKLRNLSGTVLSLLTGGGGNNNYWHWLFDVLPRLNLCSKVINLNKVDFFLLPNLLKKFQKETLDFLNIPEHKRLSSVKFRHIKTNELIVTDHPVVVSGDASEDLNNPPVWIIEWLKEKFLNQNLTTNKKKVKIYIDRDLKNSQQSDQRIIENEKEVKKFLLSHNFVTIQLHNMRFSEQVDLFNNAECIVGLHGAGFVNSVFSKPGTKVIELRSLTSGNAIQNISKKNNLNYIPIIVESKKIDQSNIPNQQGSYKMPINSLIKEIEN